MKKRADLASYEIYVPNLSYEIPNKRRKCQEYILLIIFVDRNSMNAVVMSSPKKGAFFDETDFKEEL